MWSRGRVRRLMHRDSTAQRFSSTPFILHDELAVESLQRSRRSARPGPRARRAALTGLPVAGRRDQGNDERAGPSGYGGRGPFTYGMRVATDKPNVQTKNRSRFTVAGPTAR